MVGGTDFGNFTEEVKQMTGNETEQRNEPQWEEVDSSRFKAMRYDPGASRLSIRWKDGKVGHYHDVPQEAYEKLRMADSLGKYLQVEIIPRYKYEPDKN